MQEEFDADGGIKEYSFMIHDNLVFYITLMF